MVELNEAFAAQALAVLRELGIADDAEHVNPNGGAIALGPSAGHERRAAGHHRALRARAPPARGCALCTMCIGVGQGIALAIERL